MTLCWTPNNAISAMSVITASATGADGPALHGRWQHGEISDKADQIEEGREEDRISDQ
jgi:hypothetical protein